MIWASVNLDFLIALFLEDAEVSIFRLSLQRGSLRSGLFVMSMPPSPEQIDLGGSMVCMISPPSLQHHPQATNGKLAS
jgi:hypothetical protein